MKRWISAVALWLVISLFLAACGTSTPGAGKPAVGAKILVGTDATFPPFESVTADRRTLIGFDIDLMKAIAAKSSFDVEMTNAQYEVLLARIADCTYDAGIAAITVDDNLKSSMSFSDPYFAVGQVVVVKKGNPRITGRETLVGQTVGVQTGTTSASEVAKIVGARAKPYPAINQAFDELVSGLIDAVVADNTQALSYTNIRANNLKIVGAPFAGSSYGIAVCNQRVELLQRINAGLAAVRADGTLDRLTQKWIISGGP